MIAGFDLSTLKSGCAIIEKGRAFLFSLVLDDRTKLEERIHRHAEWAREIARAFPVECCFHEEVIHVNRGGGFHENGKFDNIRTALMIAQVVGAVKREFYPAIVHPLTPSEWRAATVGNIPATRGMSEREALKAAAITYARAHGVNPKTDDEAEAYCVALAGLKSLS